MGAVEGEGGQACRIEAIVMSAGEMESDRAGAPGFLIRQRYRMAAQRAKARGKLTCLLINDIDAGLCFRALQAHPKQPRPTILPSRSPMASTSPQQAAWPGDAAGFFYFYLSAH